MVSSLTLDSRSDECIPIIARIFPGKSKEDILWLHPASNEIQSNLRTLRKKMFSPRAATKSPDKNHMRPYSPLHSFKLDLKVAEEEEEEHGQEARDRLAGKDGLNSDLQLVDSGSDTVGTFSKGNDHFPSSSSKLSQLEGVKVQVCYPIQQCGVSAPTGSIPFSDDTGPSLPQLVSNSQQKHHRVMPELKECLHEEEFHRAIYYSKKFVSEKTTVKSFRGAGGENLC